MIQRMLPWLTEDAISFLEDFFQKNPNAKILEFGCGGSTIWFSKRTPNITSIEHDERWYNSVSKYLSECNECSPVDLRLIKSNYYLTCDEFPDEYFDFILVDGKDRVNCIERCIRILKPGGILMLDNSERERYKPIYKMLKDWPVRITVQTEPDPEGFYDPTWQTTWWIKPEKKEIKKRKFSIKRLIDSFAEKYYPKK